MFILGIYLPSYQDGVISYLYNVLSGPVFICASPGGTVLMEGPILFPPNHEIRPPFYACIMYLYLPPLSHMSGIISYLISHSHSI